MTIASVDSGAVTLVVAPQGTPDASIFILAPIADLRLLTADRARHMAYEEAVVHAGTWAGSP